MTKDSSFSVIDSTLRLYYLIKKISPANRIRTSDLRMTEYIHYSPPLYQLSYHGITHAPVVYNFIILIGIILILRNLSIEFVLLSLQHFFDVIFHLHFIFWNSPLPSLWISRCDWSANWFYTGGKGYHIQIQHGKG